ncbi:MAG TPA: (2Fe-2S)-binding protein [Gemmatales bacterium]|nr:(2Fe-2S)-binding protein [Gemmatales bacterium]HMP16062.1 (2Fe-2S)-binding protein [Gemmatales bacterium]
MNLDGKICYCFHVSRRKLVNFCHREKPRVASQLSECGGAGTGCGWCIPFLIKIFNEYRIGKVDSDLDSVSPQEYAEKRAQYIKSGRGKPAPNAKPLPDNSKD